MSNVSR